MRSAGYFDLQVNGFAGVDFNASTIDGAAFERCLETMLATGVTTFLPTIITATPAELASRFDALDAAVTASPLGRAMVPGYHLEGPFLNPADGYAGCHPPAAMTAPDAALVERLAARLSRPILLVTVAPEGPGGEAFVRAMRAAGRIVAIGHSAADVAGVAAAAEAGASLSTHLGNGLPQILPKLDNTLFAQLGEDRLFASFIADGIHVPPQALKSLVRAKGSARSILVTDAVAAAATPPGRYPFAGMEVEHAADGSVRVPGGRSLAGSALTMDRAVQNVVAWGVATPEEAFAMASLNPAALMASAAQAFGVVIDAGEVEWDDAGQPIRVGVGGIERHYAGGTRNESRRETAP